MDFITRALRSNWRKSKRRCRASLFSATQFRCETLEHRLLLAIIDVAGDLPAGTTTWASGDIQHVTGNVRVPLGSTLVIQPGASIKFNSSADLKLLVDGTLLAQGTTQQPIIFTSMDDDTGRDAVLGTSDDDDTNGNGPSNGFPGAWESITISSRSGSPSILDHVDVRFAGENVPAAVITAGPLTIANSTIRNCATSGMRIITSSPVLTNTTFISNGASFGAAISMDLSSNPAISGVTLTNNRVNGVNLDGGTLTQDAVWDDADIVYRMTSSITVPAGKTLNIGAGQIVKTTNDYFLGVAGTLQASGTPINPIIFTSDSDDSAGGDTTNDGATNASPGDPGGVRFTAGSAGSVLDSVNVRFAGDPSSSPGGAIAIDNAQVTIHGGVISNSASAGLRIVNSDPIVSGMTFTNNFGAAISMDLASNPTITSPTLTNNSFNGLALDGFSALTEDGLWDDTDIAYRLTGPVTVPAGKTLTIAPGMIIKAAAGVSTELFVDGTLIAAGAPSAPIIFTSVTDDTAGGDSNNDGQSVGHFHDWESIHIRAMSTGSVLDRVQVRFAGANATAAVIASGGPLTMTNSTVTGSAAHAFAAQSGTTVLLENNLFINSNGTGIRAESGSTVTAINNTIDGGLRGASASGAGTLLTLTNDLITNNSVAGVESSNRGIATISYSDVFNPGAFQGDYTGLPSQTGISGNLSADPKYADRAALDFHLQAGSPAIDAGTSGGAPIDDLDFNFRADDPQTPNTGAGQSPFFDMGAYERAGKPRALKHAPSGKVADVVSLVVFTFRGAMDTGSFSIASDVVSFTGPSGAINVTAFTWLNPYQLQLNFNAQAKAGDYQLVLGPNILNSNHQALDVDGDGVRGESVDDLYTATWTIVPPRVIRQSPSDLTGAPLDHLEFTFDRPMDQTSFSLSGDVISFTGPNGNVSATGFAWTDPSTLRISFAPQAVLGSYEIVLGPNIADTGGNLLDQSGNGVGGEDPADRYIAAFALADILIVSGPITQNTTWNGLVIVDDAVTVQSGVTLTINPGTIVKIADLVGLTVQSGATLRSNGTTAQPVRITSIHDDTIGGDSDHNGNRIGPQTGDWISLEINDGTANFESTQILYGGGSTSGVWNQSGMVRTTGNSTLTISRSILRDAFFDGVLAQGGPATITNSIITGADRGVVAWASNSHVQVVNSTFVENRIGLLGHGGTLNVVNSIVSNSLEFGIDNDIDPDPTVSFSNIFTPVGTTTRGFPDPIGSNGNVSKDPKFRDLEHQNYRLSARSPVIDAANGSAAPATDAVGSPRVDDSNITNTGTAAPGGAFADIGAFEFVADAPSDLDLVITAASGPASAMEGQTVSVQWTTKNIGTGVARGQWHDGVYLSADTVWTPDDLLLGEALHSGDLGPNQSYAGSADLAIPGVLPGTYHLLVRANNDDAVFEGRNVNNNVTAAAASISLDVPTLTLGVPLTGQLATTGDARVYKVDVPAGSDLRVALNGPAAAVNELYLKQGDVPTRQSFDSRGVIANQSDQSVSLGGLTGDTVFVLVYATGAPTGETFTLTASLPGFSITGISPARGANSGQVTISIAGAQFSSSSHPQLVDSQSGTIEPSKVYFQDSTLVAATFDLSGHPTGLADVKIVNAGNVTTTLNHAFNIITGEPGRLITNLIAPDRVRAGRDFTIYLEYSNAGDTDLLAPIFHIANSGPGLLSVFPDHTNAASELDLVGVASRFPAGVLPPGAIARLPLYSQTSADANAQVNQYQTFIGSYKQGAAINWTAISPLIKPVALSDAEWNPIFNQLKSNIGDSWADFQRAISEDATLLTPELGSNSLLADDLDLELNQAKAALNTTVSGRLFLGDTQHIASNVRIQLSNPNDQVPIVGLPGQTFGRILTTASLTDGTFSYQDVPDGTYDVIVSGFLIPPTTVTIAAQDISNLDLTLQPGGAISGLVVAADDGEPVRNASVSAASDGGTFSTSTDSQGHYRIEGLPGGDYTVNVSNVVGLAGTQLLVDALTTAQERGNVNFALRTPGSISGVVGGPSGGVAGATVAAVGADGSGASTTSDSNGAYTLSGLNPDMYTIIASSAGLVTKSLEGVSVTEGQSLTNFGITLSSAGSIGGTVLKLDGSPAQFYLIDAQSGNAFSSAQTDSVGNYSIENLQPGAYTLTVHGQGLMDVNGNATVVAGANTDLNFTLAPFGTVTGVVTNSTNGQPLAGVTVFAVGTDSFTVSDVTGVDGSYSLSGLDAGSYTVAVGDTGTPGITMAQVTVSPAASAPTRNFSVAIAGVVTGTVFAADGTTPLASAVVALSQNGNILLSHTADNSGHYSFFVLAGGTYTLVASATGAAFAPQSVNLTGAAAVARDLVAGQRALSGTVTRASDSQLISGATVRIYSNDTNAAAPFVGESITGADGSFTFSNLADGDYTVIASASALALDIRLVTIAGGNQTGVALSLGTEGRVHGVATDLQTSMPLSGATVLISSRTTPTFQTMRSTDDTGAYDADNLPLGTYDVVVVDAGHISIVTATSLAAGDNVLNVSLATSTTTLHGNITATQGGTALPGVRVRVLNANGFALGEAITAADGSYSIDTLAPGNYTVAVSVAGYLPVAPAASSVSSAQSVQGPAFSLQAVALSDPPDVQAFAHATFAGADEPPVPTQGWFEGVKSPASPEHGTFTLLTALHLRCDSKAPLQSVSLDRLFFEASNNFMALERERQSLLTRYTSPVSSGQGLRDFLDLQGAFEFGRSMNLVDIYLRLIQAQINDLRRVHPELSTDLDNSYQLLLGPARANVNVDAFLATSEDKSPDFHPSTVELKQQTLTTTLDHLDDAQQRAALFATAVEQIVKQHGFTLEPVEIIQGGRLGFGEGLSSGIYDIRVGDLSKYVQRLSDKITKAKTTAHNRRSFLAGIEDYLKAKSDYEYATKFLMEEEGRFRTECEAHEAREAAQNFGTATVNTLVSVSEIIKGAVAETIKSISHDPNDKSGPAGFGSAGFIQPGTMPFKVEFENASTAQAAAQVVTVTDTLDTSLDLSTFQFTGFGFRSFQFDVPAGLTHYQTIIDLRPDNINLLVPVSLDLNATTRQIRAVFSSLDPDTQLPPDGVLDGLLPPNDATHRGEGFFTYLVSTQNSLPTGTQITNQASIVFDTNEPILTPTTHNTIDAGTPTSSVTALAATSGPIFAVKWSGSDDSAGSGIGGYDVFVSDNGGAFTLFQSNTPATSASFTGQINHTYAFYSTAHDNLGQIESAPTTADTTTAVTTPAASVVAKNVTKAASSYTFKVTYIGTSSAPINTASIGSKNILVTGPRHFKQLATVVSKKPSSGNAASITVTYKIIPPGGSWDTADNGSYTIKLVAKQIKDTTGKVASAATLGIFSVNVVARPGRVARATFSSASQIMVDDLTGVDWAEMEAPRPAAFLIGPPILPSTWGQKPCCAPKIVGMITANSS